MNLKSIFDKIRKAITWKNFNLALVKLEKGVSVYSKAVRTFNTSMEKLTQEFSNDVSRSRIASNDRERINKHHLKNLWGESKKNLIWSDKKTRLF